MKDKEVKEKLESLDALSGGIVFGKEEAWDKLQARMDKPPVKRIAIRYKMYAAAAMLLFFVTIIAVYTYPEKQIAANQPLNPSQVSDTETMVVTAAPIEQPIADPKEEKAPPAIKREVPPVKFVVKQPTQPTIPQPVDTAIPQPAVVTNTPSKPAMTPVKKMRVVHINDMGKETGPEQETMIAYTGPSLDISKMKVVSIYDVQRDERTYNRQEEDIMTIARINRPHSNLFSLPYPLGRNNTGSNSFAQNRLTIRLNRNN